MVERAIPTLQKDVWVKISERYVGSSQGDLYVSLYMMLKEQDVEGNRSKILYNVSGRFTGNYIFDNQGAAGCGGTGLDWTQIPCTRINGSAEPVTLHSAYGWASHNTDGTCTVSGSAAINFPNHGWTGIAEGSAILPSIPRQVNIVSAPNFADDENPTITYDNPVRNVVSSVQACISLDGTTDHVRYRTINKDAGQYTFNLSTNDRNVLRSACVNGSSATVWFILKSNVNGTYRYSSTPKTFSISNGAPTVYAYAEEQNSTYINLTGSRNKIIKGYNRVRAWMNITPNKGASITSKVISNGGMGVSGSDVTFDNTGSNLFNFYVEDSRGNVVNKQVAMQMVDYFPPTCTADIGKPTTSGSMDVRAEGRFFNSSFGYSYNSISVKVRYKAGNGSYSSWQTMSVSASGNTFNANKTVTGLDYRQSYTVQVRAEDHITYADTRPTSVQAMPVYFWGKSKFAVNVPAIFKENVDVKSITVNGQDIGGADKVVDSGEDYTWGWRKWSSGTAECWARIDLGTIDCTASWTSIYYGTYGAIDLPYGLFKETPVVNIHAENSNVWVTHNFNSKAQIPALSILTTVSGHHHVYANIYAIGKWQ